MKINLIKEQIKRQSKICSDTYYSVTTCGMCPAVNIVDVRDETHKCHNCGWEDDISSFPDICYEGMEINNKHNELGSGPYDHLEYVEVQYGNEVEIWEDPKTGDAYEVPIDIERHFHIAKKLN